MPATTPTGYPYALPGDALTDWPDQSKLLAEQIPMIVSGGTSVHLADGEDVKEHQVTFGRTFPTAPDVVASAGNSSYNAATKAMTTTGFTVTLRRLVGSGADDVAVRYIAVVR